MTKSSGLIIQTYPFQVNLPNAVLPGLAVFATKHDVHATGIDQPLADSLLALGADGIFDGYHRFEWRQVFYSRQRVIFCDLNIFYRWLP